MPEIAIFLRYIIEEGAKKSSLCCNNLHVLGEKYGREKMAITHISLQDYDPQSFFGGDKKEIWMITIVCIGFTVCLVFFNWKKGLIGTWKQAS